MSYPLPYTVRIDRFEGPLDLLLHLIRKNEMDIKNIEIAKITDQYLEHINAMRVLDVDLASEFIVMAATLIYIKSKMLLPSPEAENEEEDLDPRQALMERLIEYQTFKWGAESLASRPLLGDDLFKVRVIEEAPREAFDPKEGWMEVGIYELAVVLNDLLVRCAPRVHHIESNEVSLEERILDIVNRLNHDLKKAIEFKSLMTSGVSRAQIIVTFLALLELTRLRCVKLFQAVHGSDIHIQKTEQLFHFDVRQIRILEGALRGGEHAA